MVTDHIRNCARYAPCDGNIKAALDFMKEKAGDRDLEDGTYVVVPDEVTAYVLSKESKAVSECQMEIHKKYMDIHFILEGAERCGFAPLQDDVAYDEETDNGFYQCDDTSEIVVREGEFYMVWPLEPHRPLCNVGTSPEQVRKIICKVRIHEGAEEL